MSKYQFKTNINCSGCIARITPYLNGNQDINSWEVDTANPNKILTVETERLNKDTLKELVKQAGFKAENM